MWNESVQKERREAVEKEKRRGVAVEREIVLRSDAVRKARLLKTVPRWENAQRVRSYIAEVRAEANRRLGTIDASSEAGRWLQWAEVYLDSIDPFSGRRELPSYSLTSKELESLRKECESDWCSWSDIPTKAATVTPVRRCPGASLRPRRRDPIDEGRMRPVGPSRNGMCRFCSHTLRRLRPANKSSQFGVLSAKIAAGGMGRSRASVPGCPLKRGEAQNCSPPLAVAGRWGATSNWSMAFPCFRPGKRIKSSGLAPGERVPWEAVSSWRRLRWRSLRASSSWPCWHRLRRSGGVRGHGGRMRGESVQEVLPLRSRRSSVQTCISTQRPPRARRRKGTGSWHDRRLPCRLAPGRHPTASFFCPRFFCQPGIHGPGCEGKPGKKIEGKKMGGGMQQKETKATKQVHPLRSLCGLLFGLPSPGDGFILARLGSRGDLPQSASPSVE